MIIACPFELVRRAMRNAIGVKSSAYQARFGVYAGGAQLD